MSESIIAGVATQPVFIFKAICSTGCSTLQLEDLNTVVSMNVTHGQAHGKPSVNRNKKTLHYFRHPARCLAISVYLIVITCDYCV